MTKVWSSFAFGSGLDLFYLARVIDIEVLISHVKFGSFSRLLFGEHDSFAGNDVDTRALHYFALFCGKVLVNQ